MAKTSDIIRQVTEAAAACEEKKAEDISILELDKAAGGFTDYFVICSGANSRQIQAIADEVERRLQRKASTRPTHVEGYRQAEWVLLDYVDFVVHVFSQRARNFYNLERLWKSAKQFTAEELRKKSPARRPQASRSRQARERLKAASQGFCKKGAREEERLRPQKAFPAKAGERLRDRLIESSRFDPRI